MVKIFKFSDEVNEYQGFVRTNIRSLGNLQIIAEQFCIYNDVNCFIDILAFDFNTNRLTVIELKNMAASDAVVGQILKYNDYIRNAHNDIQHFVNKCGINFAIEGEPKFLLVVPDFQKQIISSFGILKNILDVDIIKFNAIQKDKFYEIIKEVYSPDENIYENETFKIKEKQSEAWDFNKYAKKGINNGKLVLAKQLINFVDGYCKNQDRQLKYYFKENQINLKINKNTIGSIKIKNKNLYDDNLQVTFNKEISPAIVRYCAEVREAKYLTNKTKLELMRVPTDLLTQILDDIAIKEGK